MVLRTTSVSLDGLKRDAVRLELPRSHGNCRFRRCTRYPCPSFVPHGLVASGEVNDTEPPHGEREVLAHPTTFIVGPAVSDGACSFE